MSFLPGLFENTTTPTTTTVTPNISPTEQANYDSNAAQQQAIREAAAGLPPSQVAGLDPMETQAYADTGTAVNAANTTSQTNAGLIDPSSQYQMQKTAGPAAGLTGLTDLTNASYDLNGNLNPYTDAVVDTTLASMQRTQQQEQLARDAQASAVGGLSNTRAAVGDAVAQNLGNMSQAQMEAQLRSGAFNSASAQALARQQADQAAAEAKSQFALQTAQAQAAQGNTAADFGLAQETALANASNNAFDNSVTAATSLENLNQNEYLRSLGLAGVEGSLGETQRGLTQQTMDIPKSDLTYQAGINNAVNPGAAPVGQTTTGETVNPSMFNQLLGAASSAAGAYYGSLPTSDRRAKENITPTDHALDKLARLSAFEYDYKPGFGHTKARTSGLMADDVALSGIKGGMVEIDGIKHVDSYAVLATVVQAVNELRQMHMEGAGL